MSILYISPFFALYFCMFCFYINVDINLFLFYTSIIVNVIDNVKSETNGGNICLPEPFLTSKNLPSMTGRA